VSLQLSQRTYNTMKNFSNPFLLTKSTKGKTFQPTHVQNYVHSNLTFALNNGLRRYKYGKLLLKSFIISIVVD